jgi:hypothetical protein
MRILGSVVAPSTSLVALRDPEITGGSPIRSEIIRDELVWDKADFFKRLRMSFNAACLFLFAWTKTHGAEKPCNIRL